MFGILVIDILLQGCTLAKIDGGGFGPPLWGGSNGGGRALDGGGLAPPIYDLDGGGHHI